MTAPTQQEQATTQPVPRVRHKLCYVQAVAAHYGHPRITLCGKTVTGPKKKAEGLPGCPMCMDVLAEHRATCPACQKAGWTA